MVISKAGFNLFHCFALINIMFGSTVGIYNIYMAALQKTPWMFLLILPLLLRIAPINIWARVLSKIFPAFQKSPEWFSFLPRHLPTTIMVCSLFWFLGFIRGFEGAANILKNVSRDIYGRPHDYPFQVMYPSFALRSSCIQRKSMFDCHRLRGWIDTTSASRVVKHIYAALIDQYENEYVADRKNQVLRELESITFYDSSVPELRIWYGNYSFLDPFFRIVSLFHFIDFIMLLILGFFIISVVESGIKAKLVLAIVLLLQITPMMSQIVRFDQTDLISFISMLVVWAIVGITIIAIFYFLLHSWGCRRSFWFQLMAKFFLYFPFILIPIQFLAFSRTNHVFFYASYDQMVELCEVSKFHHHEDMIYVNDMSIENKAFLSAQQILSQDQISFIDQILTTENDLFTTSFLNVLLEVYFAVLVLVVSLPLLAIVSFETMAVARFSALFSRRFLFFLYTMLGLGIAVYPLYLGAVHPRYAMFWPWWSLRLTDSEKDTLKWTTDFRETFRIRERDVSFDWLDLDGTNSTLKEMMLSHLRGRMGGLIHSIYGMRGCGFGNFLPGYILYHKIAQYTAELRLQYIVLNKYLLYGHFNYGTFVPLALFLGAYLFVGDKKRRREMTRRR